jgi:virulence-associated protein VapD
MAQVVSEIKMDISPQQYNDINKELESIGLGHPKGRLYHVAVSKDGGMEVIAVWESEMAFQEFSRSLVPILEKQGIPTNKRPDLYPVYRIVQ